MWPVEMLPPPNATALLQVLQAKSTEGHARGGHDPEVLKVLAPRATKVMARSLGCAMSTLVVQECHLWLCLVDIGTPDKVWFLKVPVSQTGLFGDATGNMAQQFLAAQELTEVI